MNPFKPPADTGDLIAARKDIHTTVTEQLTNAPGIRQGTRGLVRKRTSNRLTVAFDTGYGLTETTVPARDCRLIQRTISEKRFMEWAQFKAAIRVGALITLAVPIVWYILVYWVHTGSVDGVIDALTLSAIESAVEIPGLILAHPAQTLIWLLLGSIAARIALGEAPGRKRRRR